jgi:hypothetical protein
METLTVNVYNNFDSRHVIVSVPSNFTANELVNKVINYYNLPTNYYVYSLYLDEDDFDFIHSSCFGVNNEINEIDYISPNSYLTSFLISGTILSIKLVQEYKITYIMKQYLRCFNLI